MTFQELARNIYEAAQFHLPANQRTSWDHETLAVKLRYQRAAKMAMGLTAALPGDLRRAFRIVAKNLALVSPAHVSTVTEWAEAGLTMPAYVLDEIGKALVTLDDGEG